LKIRLVALIGIAFMGCGRSALESPSSSAGGSSAAAGASTAAGGAGHAAGAGGAAVAHAPVPTCTGENSKCVFNDAGLISGASIIQCDGVYFVGPWTLLLERLIGSQFEVIQVQQIEEPGFGATFDDMTGPPAELTYRVCTVDKQQGTKCGASFTTFGPVDCACEPLTCHELQSCFTLIDDGCGGKLHCGACSNGAPCNPSNDSCCPVGQEPDGTGGCQCAPPSPCHGTKYWDPNVCACVLPN
jgi:hypothetical protein